jgi:hypothetical protein
MTEGPGLYERLAQARQEFQKKADFKKVKTGGLQYAYLPTEAAKPLIEECTSKVGVTIVPTDMEILPAPFTFRDGKQAYVTAVITFELSCQEESKELRIMAEANDYSDKAINKVYTMAYKNLIKIVFGFSESAKDDSKFSDAREQDNDFNQAEVPKRVPAKKEGSAPVDRFGKWMEGGQ